MNSRLNRLQSYPFEKLNALFSTIKPSLDHAPLSLSIGEPKHPPVEWMLKTLQEALPKTSIYPTTRGDKALREAIKGWISQRFSVPEEWIDPDQHILPVNGTREALFSIAQTLVDEKDDPLVLMPNPFYQIYEGATLMAGGTPYYVDATEENGFLPDYAALPEAVLERTQLVYLCTPSNPTGATYNLAQLKKLIALADQYDFIIASDECYSEIWYDTPPAGILEAATDLGRDGFQRCLAFHSLSKRSNLPGARTGFVAGDAEILKRYFQLRTYTGCATPPFIQHLATAAWQDEQHVEDNRKLYRQKLADALEILAPLKPQAPQASFYLWLKVPGGGKQFAMELFEKWNVVVLPGEYLGRENPEHNPAAPFIRIALVESLEKNREALQRLAACAKPYL
ncbi:succinyldiaminopimelate transaminase [Magnetococcales bacterium HHB-1]